jgi:heptaprenyl diphosphate synthase
MSMTLKKSITSFFPKGRRFFSTAKPNVEFFEKYRNIYEKNKVLEKIIPKKLNNAKEIQQFFNLSEDRVLKLEDPVIVDSINSTVFTPCWKLVEGPGKRWRPVYGLVFAKLLRANFENDPEQLKLLMDLFSMIEFTHVGQLVLDDIADQSMYRREVPCLHIQYNIGTGLYTGINLWNLPFKRFADIRPDVAAKIRPDFEEGINFLSLGQVMKEYISDSHNIPFYESTSILTSGSTARFIMRSVFKIYGGDDSVLKELDSINDLMWLAHQIKDDIANIVPSYISRIKCIVGDDIGAGKYTPMVIHALKNSDEKSSKRLHEILKLKTTDQVLLDEAIEIIKKSGGIQLAEKMMWQNYNSAVERINRLRNTLDKKKYDLEGLDELHGYAYQLTVLDK